MFCPQCGLTQPDELNFCKACGANLGSVRTALDRPGTADKFDWNKTWLAEMMMSSEEKIRRAAEIERIKVPAVRRRNEIKAGVITASVGIGLSIATFVIMEGIVASGAVSAVAAAILSRVWIAALIPIFVGTSLIINGVFVSPKGVEPELPEPSELQLAPVATNELGPAAPFSVTDETTKHLDAKAAGDK